VQREQRVDGAIMRIRIAKLSDSKEIAEIHFASRDKLAKGFFSQVSKLFLLQYYKVVLNDPELAP
jgi:hypothetical protein